MKAQYDLSVARKNIFFNSVALFALLLLLISVLPVLVARVIVLKFPADKQNHLMGILLFATIALVLVACCIYSLVVFRSIHLGFEPAKSLADTADIQKKLAHDLKSPIVTLSQVKRFLEESSGGSEEVKDAIFLLGLSYKRLEALTTDLLKNSKIEVTKSKDNLVAEHISVHQALDEILAEFQLQPVLSDVTFKKRYTSATPSILMQKSVFQRIVANLVKNAIEAMNYEGIIEVVTIQEALNLVLVVRDTGHGLSEEQIVTLRKYSALPTLKVTGNGVGLHSVFSEVKRIGGYIDVESKLDVGTTFKIHFPDNIVMVERAILS